MKSLDPIVELRRAIASAPTRRQWAIAHGLSNAYVGEVLAGKRSPGPAILEAIGLERTITIVYRRAASAQAA